MFSFFQILPASTETGILVRKLLNIVVDHVMYSFGSLVMALLFLFIDVTSCSVVQLWMVGFQIAVLLGLQVLKFPIFRIKN